MCEGWGAVDRNTMPLSPFYTHMQGPHIRVAGQHRDRPGREVRRVLTKRASDSFATRRADRGRARESGFLSRLFQRSVALVRRRGADPCPGARARLESDPPPMQLAIYLALRSRNAEDMGCHPHSGFADGREGLGAQANARILPSLWSAPGACSAGAHPPFADGGHDYRSVMAPVHIPRDEQRPPARNSPLLSRPKRHARSASFGVRVGGRVRRVSVSGADALRMPVRAAARIRMQGQSSWNRQGGRSQRPLRVTLRILRAI